MRRSTRIILWIAAACGVGTAAWVAISSPRAGLDRSFERRYPGAARTFQTRPVMPAIPTDRDGLEAYVTVEPQDYSAWFRLAYRRRWQGDVEGAEQAFRTASECAAQASAAYPDAPYPSFVRGYVRQELGQRAEARRFFAEAAALYERHLANPDWESNPTPWLNLGWCRRHLGDERGAHGAWTRAVLAAEARLTPGDPVSLFNLACYRALAGRRDGALDALRQSIAAGWNDRELTLNDDDLASLRDDAAFAEMAQRIVKQP
ncbi:MAG: tetratricopeptide repeat protein [Phycisphaerales bacterium]